MIKIFAFSFLKSRTVITACTIDWILLKENGIDKLHFKLKSELLRVKIKVSNHFSYVRWDTVDVDCHPKRRESRKKTRYEYKKRLNKPSFGTHDLRVSMYLFNSFNCYTNFFLSIFIVKITEKTRFFSQLHLLSVAFFLYSFRYHSIFFYFCVSSVVRFFRLLFRYVYICSVQHRISISPHQKIIDKIRRCSF